MEAHRNRWARAPPSLLQAVGWCALRGPSRASNRPIFVANHSPADKALFSKYENLKSSGSKGRSSTDSRKENQNNEGEMD